MWTGGSVEPYNSLNEYRATINRFIASTELTQFVKTMRSIDLGKYPAYNCFALNFRDDSPVNFKVYFSFNRKLNFNEILRVLPTTADIEPFYPLFTESKNRDVDHTGFSLAIKIDQNLKATYQVHFRFLYSPLLPQPKLVKLTYNDYKYTQGVKYTQGISFEYTGKETFRKNYYYLRGSSAFKTVLSRFGGLDRNHLLEYTETDKWSKVIHWYYYFLDIQNHIESLKGSNYHKFTRWIETEYGVTALYPGVYDDQRTRSIYFFSTQPKPNLRRDLSGSANIETINRLRICP